MNLKNELLRGIKKLNFDQLNERIREVEKKLKYPNLSDSKREDLDLEFSLLQERMEEVLSEVQ